MKKRDKDHNTITRIKAKKKRRLNAHRHGGNSIYSDKE